MGAKLNRGGSKQDWATPLSLIEATKNLLGIDGFQADLAATKDNTIAPIYITAEDDSLSDNIKWDFGPGWNWLNPPYSNIQPWVYKAGWQTDFYNTKTAVLVPASVGANWWRDFVHQDADVFFLNGRITFVGAPAPYPKDCALLLYHPAATGGYKTWKWK